MDPERLKYLGHIPTPKTNKELRSILQMVEFVREFIPNLASAITSLTALTRKEAVKDIAERWGP